MREFVDVFVLWNNEQIDETYLSLAALGALMPN